MEDRTRTKSLLFRLESTNTITHGTGDYERLVTLTEDAIQKILATHRDINSVSYYYEKGEELSVESVMKEGTITLIATLPPSLHWLKRR